MKIDQNGNVCIITQEKTSVIELVNSLQASYPKYKNNNIIINLSGLKQLTNQDIVELSLFSKVHRTAKHSIVIVSSCIHLDDIPDEIMITPTLQEAFDIIEMEDMERDLGF